MLPGRNTMRNIFVRLRKPPDYRDYDFMNEDGRGQYEKLNIKKGMTCFLNEMYRFESIKRYKRYLKRKIAEFEENTNNNNGDGPTKFRGNGQAQNYMRSTEASRRRESLNKETFGPSRNSIDQQNSISPLRRKIYNKNNLELNDLDVFELDAYLQEIPNISNLSENTKTKWSLPNFKEFFNSLEVHGKGEPSINLDDSFVKDVINDDSLSPIEAVNILLGKEPRRDNIKSKKHPAKNNMTRKTYDKTNVKTLKSYLKGVDRRMLERELENSLKKKKKSKKCKDFKLNLSKKGLKRKRFKSKNPKFIDNSRSIPINVLKCSKDNFNESQKKKFYESPWKYLDKTNIKIENDKSNRKVDDLTFQQSKIPPQKSERKKWNLNHSILNLTKVVLPLNNKNIDEQASRVKKEFYSKTKRKSPITLSKETGTNTENRSSFDNNFHNEETLVFNGRELKKNNLNNLSAEESYSKIKNVLLKENNDEKNIKTDKAYAEKKLQTNELENQSILSEEDNLNEFIENDLKSTRSFLNNNRERSNEIFKNLKTNDSIEDSGSLLSNYVNKWKKFHNKRDLSQINLLNKLKSLGKEENEKSTRLYEFLQNKTHFNGKQKFINLENILQNNRQVNKENYELNKKVKVI
ncbi:DgyrCDS1721 [Dimorphilus gyrociliatus]|uniref:DgyrCDS1721 n=1 Tax=Dimorphilus gyrociliatus TaxID=2664684 RepID=A0A7I8V9M0_9ANNE|nr:DgyrCDS1721 [Dimorphilus gyrociliatus]